jgi:hypothetical protein
MFVLGTYAVGITGAIVYGKITDAQEAAVAPPPERPDFHT